MSYLPGMKVKKLSKCESGQAFEIILKPPVADSDDNSPLRALSLRKKKDISLDDINYKLTAAEERRKSRQRAVVIKAKTEEERVLIGQQKKAEECERFVQKVEVHLRNKWELYEENHLSKIRGKVGKLREMNSKPDALQEKAKREVAVMYHQLEWGLQL